LFYNKFYASNYDVRLMCGAVLPLPQYVFMAWWLLKHRENFTFTFYLYFLSLFTSFNFWSSWL